MATINLLPWRDELRQEKTRQFVSVLILLIVLGGLMGYVWYQVTSVQVDYQVSRNALLIKEISVLDVRVSEISNLKKQREDLESKMRVIQNLQNKRPLIVYYFDEVVKAVPDGVYLQSLKREDDLFSIRGQSASNNRVSTFMRNIDRSVYFQSPSLRSVNKEGFELAFEGNSGTESTAK